MTSDSKAPKRFPCLHDFKTFAMMDEVFSTLPGKVIAAVNLCRKCYQRDRRVGPKCRRVEYDDVASDVWAVPVRVLRHGDVTGRRSTDKTSYYNLPRKSDRLAREAAEPEEIPVSEGMIGAAQIVNPFWEWGPSITDMLKQMYRAMERVRREEETAKQVETGCQTGCGQGAPCGASVPGGSVVIKDRRVNNERRGRPGRNILAWTGSDRRCKRCRDRRKDDPK